MNLFAGLLGLIFMTLSKMQSVKKDFDANKQPFVLKKFFSGEIIGIGMSFIVIILMAITVQEWVKVSPKVADYVTIIFALGGAIGSWAFLLLLGTSRKYIRKVIESKTAELESLKADK